MLAGRNGNLAARSAGSLLGFALLALAALAGCRAPRGEGGTLFHGGRIYLDADGAPRSWILVRAGRVVSAGNGEPPGGAAPRIERIDLAGGVAVPGLQDAHGHMLGLGESLESVDLLGCASYAELVARVRARAEEQPAGTWITGRGWDQTLWPENAFPHHEALSRAVPDHPVLVRRVGGHAALANANALARAGLLEARPVPAPEGGEVIVGADGRPTGVLVDTAVGLVGRHRPPPDRATLRRRILLAQDALLAHGLVGVHTMGLSPEVASIYEELVAEGRLRLRVIGYLWANDGLAESAAARYPRPEDADPSERLRIIGCKLMMDGAVGSRGAALLAPYEDAPEQLGLPRMSAEAFQARVDAVADAGLQPATHAIGDKANRIVLDAYARRAERDPGFARLRPRIEHAQVVAPEDWERFAALGVVPSVQPTHATSDMRWAEARLGAERVLGAYAWRRLAPDVGALAFGSDFPVESPSPLEGLYAARTRQDRAGAPEGGWQPDQRLDAREALAAFTIGVARAAREERLRGKLLPGYFCDMTVLDVDPIECEPADLLSAEVRMTVIDGEVVHRAPPGERE